MMQGWINLNLFFHSWELQWREGQEQDLGVLLRTSWQVIIKFDALIEVLITWRICKDEENIPNFILLVIFEVLQHMGTYSQL